MSSENKDIIAETLNQTARDLYLASLFLPAEKRADIQTLWAFGSELSTIRQRVSEPMPGEIRLQWWHDVLERKRDGEAASNPLAASLLSVITKYSLPTVPLLRLIAARRFDLYDDPMPDKNQFEGYAGETQAILYQLAASILAEALVENEAVANCSGHLGVAATYQFRLMNFSRDCAAAQIYLPLSTFTSFGVSDRMVLSQDRSETFINALESHFEEASKHLKQAKAAWKQIDRKLQPAFAHLPIVDAQLMHILTQSQNVSLMSKGVADWRKLLKTFLFLSFS
jgi:phytoene synthase